MKYKSPKGYTPWNKGLKNAYSEQTLNKMRQASSSSWFKKGSIPWNKGKHGVQDYTLIKEKLTGRFKGIPLSEEHKKSISNALKGKNTWQKGRKASLITRKKISEALKGSKSYLWRGGVTTLQDNIRKSFEYKILLKTSKQLDDWTCQICNRRNIKLNTDHYPKSFAQIIHDNKITSFEEALDCPEIWDLNNLRTLCIDCHKQTDTYLRQLKLHPKVELHWRLQDKDTMEEVATELERRSDV